MAWLMAGACDAGGERGEGVACRMGGACDTWRREGKVWPVEWVVLVTLGEEKGRCGL